jgi:DNA modification methylase
MIAPDLAPLVRPIATLREDPSNARRHDQRNVEAIAASLREFGQRKPIVALSDGTVLAGNGTLRAALSLGWESIAVATFEDLEQAKAYAIADNRSAELATWDDQLLVDALSAMDASLRETIGFSAAEFGRLLRAVEGLTDPDETPPLPATPVTQTGDVWILGEHRLVCGDSTDRATVERLFAGEAPVIMVTDPPYGVEYDPAWRAEAGLSVARTGTVANDDRADWREAWALFPGDVAYVWHAGVFAGVVAESLVASGFQVRAQIVWKKNIAALSRGHYHWGHEPAWYAVRKGSSARWAGDRTQSTVWEIARKDDTGETAHGTQKPVECMERPLRNHGAPGDIVFDPFLGSGSTLIAAVRARRRLFGVELSPGYCDVIIERWENFTGEKARRE